MATRTERHPSTKLYYAECMTPLEVLCVYRDQMYFEQDLGRDYFVAQELEASIKKAEQLVLAYKKRLVQAGDELFEEWLQSDDEEIRRVGKCLKEGTQHLLAI